MKLNKFVFIDYFLNFPSGMIMQRGATCATYASTRNYIICPDIYQNDL